MTARLHDEDARRRIREDLDATLVVEAAAGTGKTTALVSRIVSVLRAGAATLPGTIAVTFTEKAAGELKLRLRAEIELARRSPETPEPERRRLDGALSALEVARIGTIHSLCADLLREWPVEAGVDPKFEVMSEDESSRLFDSAFDRWFATTLADPPEGVRRVLRRRPRSWDSTGPRQLLRDAAWRLADHRDFDAPWRRDPFDREGAFDRIVARLSDLDSLRVLGTDRSDWLYRSLDEIRRFVEDLLHVESVRGRDHDALEADLQDLARKRFWRWRGRGQLFGHDLGTDVVRARRDGVREELDGVLALADADLAALLHEELRPVVDAYEEIEARTGRLDYLDLLLRARNLVARDRGVRSALQSACTHVFVDEFQDTDPLQVDLLLLLAASDPDVGDPWETLPRPGKLFLVGDPKQSIYRFRRADVALYETTKAWLVARGAEVVELATSFRSVPSLQSLVNAAFEPTFAEGDEGRQAVYVPLRPAREHAPSQPSVVALPAPRIYGRKKWEVAKWMVEESVPDAVGAFLSWLLRESGWTVTERGAPETRVPVEPRHVCILLKRFRSYGEDATRPYVRALEGRRIPHVLVGGRSFHEREEIVALRNALLAIEWPDDELSVYATLRGPFFALGDDALLAYRHAVGALRPPRNTVSEPLREVADALEVLARLHAGRNVRQIADTISSLLEETRAHAGIAIWPSGEQVLANVLRVLDLARRFETPKREGGGERETATSFRRFVTRLDEDAERGEATDAPIVEEGTEGVRVMTVHRAKGLEFPVVVLAQPTVPSTFEHPSRHVVPAERLWLEPLAGLAPVELLEARTDAKRRDEEEAVRVAYVAATRARDLLVVPVVGDEEVDGWLRALNPTVHPDPQAKRRAEVAPACPAFGGDSVLERPDHVPRGSRASVAPGLHTPRAGTHRVVWWDPHVLSLDGEEEVGLRRQRILEADEDGSVAGAGERAHEAWQAKRREVLARGSTPTHVVRSVTGIAAEWEGAQDGAAVPVEETAVARAGRPSGKDFGTLVHSILAVVDLGADEHGTKALASFHGRLLGATDEEIEAAAIAVRAALAHPLLLRAARSQDLRREEPVVLRLPDGALVEGIVDLAFRDGTGWTVVDFKTDVEIADRVAEHSTQVLLYAAAISAATGEPATGVLLSV